MSLIKGKQIATGSSGITSANVDSSIIRADGNNPFTADQPMGNHKLTGLATGVVSTDAVNLGQVQALVFGLSSKADVKYATTGVLPAYTWTSTDGGTLTANSNGAFPAQDSAATPILNDRVLVKDETSSNAPYNGFYFLSQVGDAGTPWILTRTTDANTSASLAGAFAFVESGSTNGGNGFVFAVDPASFTLNTTNVTFSQFNSTGTTLAGTGLSKSGNTINANVLAASGTTTDGSNNLKVAITTTNPGVSLLSDGVQTLQDPNGGLGHGSSGDKIVPDPNGGGTSTPSVAVTSAGLKTLGVPALFNIGTSATSSNVTAANLGTLTAGASSDAASLHGHAGHQDTITTQNITGTDTALTSTLASAPFSTASVKLFLNGQFLEQGSGKVYTLGGTGNKTITWLQSSGTAVPMDTTDTLIAIYN